MRIGRAADRPASTRDAVASPTPAARAPHYPALDLMRAGAAGMVFLFHAGIPGAPFELANGLQVFFVLSGLVVYLPFARARVRGERVAIVPYLVRRALRVYPAYLVAAFAITAIDGGVLVLDPRALATISWWPVIVMWTLAIEIQFYALVPVLDWIVRRLGRGERDRTIAIIAGFAAASLAYVAAVVIAGTTGGRTISHVDYANGLGYLWAFTGGMIVAELHVRGHKEMPPAGIAALVATGAILIVAGSVLQFALLDLMTVAGATLLAAGLLQVHLGRRTRIVAAVAASVSYSFYLWHSWVIDELHAPAPVTLLVSLAIASVVYLLVERPILRVGARAVRSLGSARPPLVVPRVPLVEPGLPG
jgi:peptidoglycan/LPS O-acetylase OafA/YrhL